MELPQFTYAKGLIYKHDQAGRPLVLGAVRRPDDQSRVSQLDVPGGQVEEGEDAFAALLREFREKAGIEPDDFVSGPERFWGNEETLARPLKGGFTRLSA